MGVRMELSRILIRELTDYQIIELREVNPANPGAGARTFPIVIGLPEAQAIERRLSGTPVKRPQTHDLLANLIEELGATLESVTINDMNENTYFATLDLLRADGELIHVDARPSDAIAIGIATQVPIWVEDHVLVSVDEAES